MADDEAQAWVTTPQIAQAVGTTRQTILSWGERGVLPQPTLQRLGARGVSSRWPAYTIPLGLYVKAALARQYSFAEVARAVRPLLAQEPGWVDAQIKAGRTIEDLLAELGSRLGT